MGDWSPTYDAATMGDAVHLAYLLARPGDTILLSPACASFDMFRDYAERGAMFKDVVKKIVEAEG